MDSIMLVVELAVVGMLAITTVGFGRHGSHMRKWHRGAAAIAAVLCVVQLAIEGPRPQLAIAYAVAALALLASLASQFLTRYRDSPRSVAAPTPKVRDRGAAILCWSAACLTLLLLLFTEALCLMFPRFVHPQAAGPFAVGSRVLHLVDRSRPEANTEAADDYRQMIVRVTYPAAVSAEHSIERIPNVRLLLPSQLWPAGLSKIATSWGRIESHSYVDPPVAREDSNYPVLVFSHGLGGVPEQNTVLIEELASRGYIVFAINHSFISQRAEFPDGGIAIGNVGPRANAIPLSDEKVANLLSVRAGLWRTDRVDEMVSIAARIEAIIPDQNAILDKATQAMSEDQQFVITELSSLQATDPIFVGKLDLSRVGVFGMSMGGSAGLRTCALDSRCRAGSNMDGFRESSVRLPTLQLPFMHINSQFNRTSLISHVRALAPSYFVRIDGARHMDFTDATIGAPLLKRLGMLGAIDGQRMLRLTNDFTIAFFDKHLRGKAEGLDAMTSTPQVGVEVRLNEYARR